MYKYLQIEGFQIPSYTIMIVVGFLICNLIAQRTFKTDQQAYKKFLLVELFGGIGAIIGAKSLTIMKLFMREGTFSLSWNDFSEAGYSYYGGVAGFFIIAYLVCRIEKYSANAIAQEYLFLLPLLHSFWKVGCFLGGCCYGKEYKGLFSVVYPAGVNALSGTSVFPSPLFEAIVSLLISIILLLVRKSKKKVDYVGLFLVLYGTTRFFLEYFRHHDTLSVLSDGQINSVICGGIGFYLYISHMRRKRDNE